jgi:hypothetical protein
MCIIVFDDKGLNISPAENLLLVLRISTNEKRRCAKPLRCMEGWSYCSSHS